MGDDQLQVSWSENSPAIFLDHMELGDSIAVDGVCLTVTKILSGGFIAAVSPETLRRTTLAKSEGDAIVNLEASLRVGSKLGGHFVTGHIDGTAYLQASVQTANAWEMSFVVPDAAVQRYIIPKGSVAINGISLTVAECNTSGSWFKVAVIPLTYQETNLQYLAPESPVNIEGDVLGKYVEKFLRLKTGQESAHYQAALETLNAASSAGANEPITPGFLAEHGYY